MTSYRTIFTRLHENDRVNGPVSGQEKKISFPHSFRLLIYSFFIFPLSLFFFSGCRSLSPLSLAEPGSEASGSAASGVVKRQKAQPRIGLEDFSPDWQPFAQKETPGLFYCSARISGEKLEFWAIKADLGEASIKIVINSGTEGKVLSTKVSSFVRNYDLLAGINAVPFDRVSAKEGEERICAGIVVSGGVVVARPVHGYDALVFYKPNAGQHGQAAILPQSEIGNLETVENALGGFRIILDEGKLPERLLSNADSPRQNLPGNTVSRHPRSAAGLSPDGSILYLLVIDGRRAGSAGATEAETGLVLKKLGAAWGLNFDGGGSSALALRFPDSRVRTVNTPIHGGIPGRERAVAACLGIGLLKKN